MFILVSINLIIRYHVVRKMMKEISSGMTIADGRARARARDDDDVWGGDNFDAGSSDLIIAAW